RRNRLGSAGWSRWVEACGRPYTAPRRKREVPPENSTLDEESTTRRTGDPRPSTAAPKGSHWAGTIKVSTTVVPSASTTAPALVAPWRGAVASQAYTPGARGASSPPVASSEPGRLTEGARRTSGARRRGRGRRPEQPPAPGAPCGSAGRHRR